MLHKTTPENIFEEKEEVTIPSFGLELNERKIPKTNIPEKPMSAREAYRIVRDECMLDGNARLNLATFVTTWMEPEAKKLMLDTMDKNMIDKSEYPQTAEIENRCVNIIANLWSSNENDDAIGCSTVGSSEACMLGGLAMKWKWRDRQKKKGLPTDKPNLVIGAAFQVVWEKFCLYWDIEMRTVPLEEGQYSLDVDRAIALCDSNTIGVVPVMGITYTGQYDDVRELDRQLDRFNALTGLEIPIHVDAASGGFITPFIQPDLVWDFRLKWVHSISTSGHKYGLVYPGVGWVVWKKEEYLPEKLIFHVDYLGGDMPTMAINFSRPGNQVLAQYYQFLRLGFEGYRKIQKNSQKVALYLSGEIERIGVFELLSKGDDIPVFCWKLKHDQPNWTLYDLADRLRMEGWQVPAYAMPENIQDIVVQRVVVKQDFSFDMADMLLKNIHEHLEYLKGLTEPTSSKIQSQNEVVQAKRFHH